MQRRMFWQCGVGSHLFHEYNRSGHVPIISTHQNFAEIFTDSYLQSLAQFSVYLDTAKHLAVEVLNELMYLNCNILGRCYRAVVPTLQHCLWAIHTLTLILTVTVTSGSKLWKLNQTQPITIYLDVSVSTGGLRQKKMKLIFLLVLAMVVMWRGKKSVVRVAQCVAALIPVHRTSSLLTNVHRLFDPSMNRDEGSYTLSHTYDRFLATLHHYRGKNQKKN